MDLRGFAIERGLEPGHVGDVVRVDLRGFAIERGLEPGHVADRVGVRLHCPLAQLDKHRLDRVILFLERVGDLAQRVEGLGGAVDELGDLHGCVTLRGRFEIRNRDLLVQRPDQILDLGDGVGVRFRRLAVEHVLELADVANRVGVLGRRLAVEHVVQVLDVGRGVLVFLVGLAGKCFADAGDVVDVADLHRDQVAQRQHVAEVRDVGVDDDLAAVAVVKGDAQRARVDLHRGTPVVVEGNQAVERASHAATSRRARCRGGQRDGVARNRAGCDVADVDENRGH